MRGPKENGAPVFRGSISRRLTVLSVLFLMLVAVVGGLSVQKARNIGTLHAESEELDVHIEVLDRLESAVFHLRADVRDALFLEDKRTDPSRLKLLGDIRSLWDRFERMHLAEKKSSDAEEVAERALSQEVKGHLERFLGVVRSILEEKPRGPTALQQTVTRLDSDARLLEEGLQRLEDVHRTLILQQTRAAGAEMAFIRWTYVVFLALGGLAVVAGSVLFVRRMAVPLRRLNAAALDVAGGNFSRQVPVVSRDEIGMLTHTFNRMAEALSERDAQVRRRAQEVEALNRIGTDISSLLKIDQVTTSVVESARTLFGADAAGLALADGTSGEIRWIVFVGGHESVFKQIRLKSAQGLAGRAVVTGLAQTVADASQDLAQDPDSHPVLAAMGLRAALAVPLRRGDRTLGALMVAFRAPRRFADDEVALLSSFANQVAVAVENAELYEQVQMLHRVGIEISSMLNLDRLLQTIVGSARAMLRTDVAALCLLREGDQHLDLVATAGPWEEVMGGATLACADDPSAERSEACLHCQTDRTQGKTAQLSTRLKLGEQVLGSLCVGSARARAFGEAEQDLLGGLATQAAIAIENARLYERVRGMAAVEERERLAREMHDGLAQGLGFLNLKLKLAERMLDGEPAEPIRRELGEMRKITSGAYEEVRQAIFGLRTMVSRGLGLVPTLSEYLHEFSQQAGIQVRLEVSDEAGQIRFAPEVEVQLIRIVQEALNNVRKHSGAPAARVRFWREADHVLVAVEDDGSGFDPGAPPKDGQRHFGLATMRERAEAVGGRLTLRSAPGRGTQVVLQVQPVGTRRGGTG
ncbi:MAG TPA: GAF domain-containing protein [Candidatus Methylomirabilis sp.]|nr:GAF domain-containing protein [Candidatus Methylomirabilis sp.]